MWVTGAPALPISAVVSVVASGRHGARRYAPEGRASRLGAHPADCQAWRPGIPRLTIEARAAEGGEASASEPAENQPYAGPGRETDRREDMPDDHADVKDFVGEVDEEAPDERLQERVRDTLADEHESDR